jgi:hypothetical protein
MKMLTRFLWLACVFAGALGAQAYSPKVLMKGQVDSSDLRTLADGIVSQAHAGTPREKAEAIWRFFLTDGRYVRPGFWYHLGGWSYEEPTGEVLDALKLLNSYGFGLCYQIAPLLEAVYEAAGFEDARVWFLTGHTVAEVFYDGGYHYFDADMMGYTPVGKGKPKSLPVASVREIAADGSLILGKLHDGAPEGVDDPWYPADVKDRAMPDLVSVFTSTADNWLFPFQRYSQGHRMEFVLRPGERMIRYFGSEEGRFYLPYRSGEKGWEEVPQDDPQYHVLTKNGPRAPHDTRDWGTGRLEYRPPLKSRESYLAVNGLQLPAASGGLMRAEGGRPGSAVFEVESPYVLIGAEFSMTADLASGDRLTLDTSTDGGLTWQPAGELPGPHQGPWKTTAGELAHSAHGALSAVAGTYGYRLRLSLNAGPVQPACVRDLQLLTRFQFNLRTLAPLHKGRNEFTYEPGPARLRQEIPIRLDQVEKTASRIAGVRYVSEAEQGMLLAGDEPGEIIYEVAAPPGTTLEEVDAGGRFLDLRNGLAPDKRTAEVRPTKFSVEKGPGVEYGASLEWAVSPAGPYTTLWTYRPDPRWKDGQPVEQLLRWPEVDRQIRGLPPGTAKLYVRYRLRNMALDDLRLAAASPRTASSPLEVIHVWFDNDRERDHVERIADPTVKREYTVDVSTGKPRNYALIYSCPPL